jgi:hypothetical protein
MARKLTSRRRIGFALTAIALALAIPILAITGMDLWLHARYARWLGYNFRGYRGDVVGGKRPGEYRIVLLGGSTAYGYAVAPAETISVFLERDLQTRSRLNRFTVINLAYNNEGAYSFAYTLSDYAYLQYDLAILFEGYNDLTEQPQNTSVFRHQSSIFQATGYLPIFPLIFREKAAALLHGNPAAMYPFYHGDKTVFRPPWTHRTSAAVLTGSAAIEEALERQFSSVSPPTPAAQDVSRSTGCTHVPFYCQSIARAVDLARASGTQVLVATQPYLLGNLRARHVLQQEDMAAMLVRRYQADGNVRYANLGNTLDLSDERLSGDRMHPTAEGNARIAAALVEPVTRLAASASVPQASGR